VLLGDLTLRERGVGLKVVFEVAAAALDEVACEALAVFAVGVAREVGREVEEGGVEETEERAELGLVAAVRGGGDEDEVALGIVAMAFQRRSSWRRWLPRPWPAAQVWASSTMTNSGQTREELVAAAVGLDVVERDHDVIGCGRRSTLARQDAALEAGGCAGEHERRVVGCGTAREACLPLLGEVRRAEDGGAVDLPAVESSRAIRQASIVLPTPTSSAMSRRTGSGGGP
jgi:hypothetical protein